MQQAPAPLRNQAPRRRRPASGKNRGARRSRPRWGRRIVLGGCGFAVLCVAWAVLARAMAPTGNTDARRFDALVVLGTPVDSDGNPTPTILAHVMEAVKEYERGVAPRLIMTGGTTRSGLPPEARVMARAAEAEGVPSSAILIEPDAMDTIHNACYAERILKAHGWHSAEIITIPTHAARSAMIFSRTPIEWRMHIAPLLEPGTESAFSYGNMLETLKTVRYLLYARWAETCSP